MVEILFKYAPLIFIGLLVIATIYGLGEHMWYNQYGDKNLKRKRKRKKFNLDNYKEE